jgi:hypothetical protein
MRHFGQESHKPTMKECGLGIILMDIALNRCIL